MDPYFPKPLERSNIIVKVELDLSDYRIENNLKKATGVNTFNLAAKWDLTSSKVQ